MATSRNKGAQEAIGALEYRPDDAEPGLAVGGLSHLHVRALHDGFRRCGRAWPAAGVEVPAAAFSDDEIAALFDEPMLVVTPMASAAQQDRP